MASDIKALFDRIAPVYDNLNQELSWGQHQVWKRMAVKWSRAKPGDAALDICCGSGDLALLLAAIVGKTGRVVGVDFATAQLAIAAQRGRDRAPDLNLTWLEGDALALPFDNATFDCATMGYGLRNVVDIPRCLQELHRVLKPGATAAILDFHRPTNPVLQALQQWYLDAIVVPTAARWGLKSDYAYIMPSLERFPQGPEQVKLAQTVGFPHAIHYPIAGGLMGVLVVTKDLN
ncbi:MAG: bifunctional demethylmenaquinone methyltransferase/2-methoxy-6-polyprenyl-1,4-benzoquinol methylase UbiE [Jaaginema sp. PMC 1079.18]|nr:bifunctional demethylmenaquinone methyltransferase/2-methoxy-6-polyprenyl-1,4-benzoquinol methylase UbiE [Jaaginema sp. PMC 1080.18]MEC4851006.1 bifunctional demethylmenaquinone methyltransferase/2-methoxy-6-polyprenyl-1,4-benzoquinol methylase UbiE [Jaaginema sp. PMC 1079.18]MEC4869049.1 bifunctional demethylmenaquinone methyltransferase/2-methoxy-6-polyprenyl-1,4-benzoquinol methylase UbiE [Jaaginema sp. PMC 1078.18]